jgi:hypothetical protein
MLKRKCACITNPMILTDLSFDFKQLQFPKRLAFDIIINRAQGQSLSSRGLNLQKFLFFCMDNYLSVASELEHRNIFMFKYLPKKTQNIVYLTALRKKC